MCCRVSLTRPMELMILVAVRLLWTNKTLLRNIDCMVKQSTTDLPGL